MLVHVPACLSTIHYAACLCTCVHYLQAHLHLQRFIALESKLAKPWAWESDLSCKWQQTKWAPSFHGAEGASLLAPIAVSFKPLHQGTEALACWVPIAGLLTHGI